MYRALAVRRQHALHLVGTRRLSDFSQPDPWVLPLVIAPAPGMGMAAVHPLPQTACPTPPRLRAMPGLDLEAGSKIPPLLAALGVEAQQIRIEADPFTSEGCVQVLRAALSASRAHLAKVVDSEDRVAAMVKDYDETLHLPGTTAVINKFIMTCRKPAQPTESGKPHSNLSKAEPIP